MLMSTRTIMTSSGPGSKNSQKPGGRYFLSGMLTFLDSPGEWWINETSWDIYAWMPDSKSPGDRHVAAPNRHRHHFSCPPFELAAQANALAFSFTQIELADRQHLAACLAGPCCTMHRAMLHHAPHATRRAMLRPRELVL